MQTPSKTASDQPVSRDHSEARQSPPSPAPSFTDTKPIPPPFPSQPALHQDAALLQFEKETNERMKMKLESDRRLKELRTAAARQIRTSVIEEFDRLESICLHPQGDATPLMGAAAACEERLMQKTRVLADADNCSSYGQLLAKMLERQPIIETLTKRIHDLRNEIRRSNTNMGTFCSSREWVFSQEEYGQLLDLQCAFGDLVRSIRCAWTEYFKQLFYVRELANLLSTRELNQEEEPSSRELSVCTTCSTFSDNSE